MADHTAVALALRARLLTLAVCTTGSVSLAATAAGFTRTTGSFVTDGFADGMQLLASGFGVAGNNAYAVVESVSALTLGVSGLTAEGAAAGRTLTVGLPVKQGWSNVPLERAAGQPYVEEEYVPATSQQRSYPAAGASMTDTGLYLVRWFGLAERGLAGIRRPVDAILDLFAPGTALSVATNLVVRVRSDLAPWAGGLRADAPGWAVVTVTIPWRLDYINS